ncbi:MAG: hypothetical protein ACLUKN_06840 [Bacilli bacterium]
MPVGRRRNAIGYVSVLEDEAMQAEAEKTDLRGSWTNRESLMRSSQRTIWTKPNEYELIPSPKINKPGSLTPPRDFNLMFQTYVGACGTKLP